MVTHYISTYTPAENLMLASGPNVQLKELLKGTFLDLLIKGVLTVTEVEKYIASRNMTFVYRYVSQGPGFKVYRPHEHEVLFINALKNHKDPVLLRHYIKI